MLLQQLLLLQLLLLQLLLVLFPCVLLLLPCMGEKDFIVASLLLFAGAAVAGAAEDAARP